MPLVIAFLSVFAFGILFNILYIGLFKGREEEIFGPKVEMFYFLHGLSLVPALVLAVIFICFLVSILVLLGELILLTFS